MRTVCAMFLSILVTMTAAAQVRITIERELGRTPIAVPDFATAPGQEALGIELANVIRYDLEFTGLFDLVSPDRFPKTFTGFTADASRIDFAAWFDTKAEYLVYAYLTLEGDEVVAECRLFDPLAAQQVVGKRFVASRKWKRSIAHKFADEIVLYLTGEPGIATSQICFSGVEDGKKEIYIADYDGANVRQMTRHAETNTGKPITILPRFSPNGNQIAYLSFKDRYPFLYIYDRLTGKSTPLSRDVGLNVSPAWAPDGNSLAIVLSKDANAEIYLVSADGSNKRRLTNDKSLDTSPAFHPGGGEIAFVSDRSGNAQIFAMALDGSNVRRLSFQGGRSYDPKWSPDGKSIAYVAEKSGEGLEIYVMDGAGSNARRLTDSSGSNESPSWSADSRHIVFASTRTGVSALWTVNVESGEQRPVPDLNYRCQGPSWGPRRE